MLKPGGHLLAFGGTRTHHRLTCALEDAGFEIRDELCWLYASGFPKSLDVSKAIDKAAGMERRVVGTGINYDAKCRHAAAHVTSNSATYISAPRGPLITEPATDAAKQWEGFGTGLKPAHEPIVLARKPIGEKNVTANVLRWGTGALNIDGCRIEVPGGWKTERGETWLRSGNPTGAAGYDAWQGPRVPTGSCADRVTDKGRWPANLILDEEAGELLDRQSGQRNAGHFPRNRPGLGSHGIYGESKPYQQEERFLHDSGGASRFFFCAKASKAEREAGLEGMDLHPFQTNQPYGEGADARTEGNKKGNRNNQPTVKPIALMRYLCRLITPPGGLILDPFLGSGTTAIAAILEGFRWTGCEKDEHYADIARCRTAHWIGLFKTPSQQA